MNKKTVLLAFASMFLLSAVIGARLVHVRIAVAAQLRIPGVSPGDWVEATWIYSGNATMPPADQMGDWGKITVQEVAGKNITAQRISRYADGSEDMDTCVVNVDTGQGNDSGIFIAANLTEGDLIYTSPPPYSGPFGVSFEGATINETIFREYLGQTEKVNHWNATKIDTGPGWTVTTTVDCYWVRATGMMTELSMYQLGQPDVGDATWMKMEVVRAHIYEEEEYDVHYSSNSDISAFEFDPDDNAIRLNVTGPDGTDGFLKICIPHDLMEPPYTVIIDDGQTDVLSYNEYSYDDVTCIHFTYLHSEHKVVIIPGFPTWTSMLLILIVLAVATAIYKRRLLKTPIH